jgi:hypothetical protein
VTNWLLVIGFLGLGAEVGLIGRKLIVKLDWQHDTIVPWINAVTTKLDLPK